MKIGVKGFALSVLMCAAMLLNIPTVYSRALVHPMEETVEEDENSYSFKLIQNADQTFGYDIYKNGKLLIHQSFIPGYPGKIGFHRKNDAVKVAALVMKKLKRGEMPPTVTRLELNQLEISL